MLLLTENLQRLSREGYCVLSDVDAPALLPIARELGKPQPDPREQVLVKDIHPQPVSSASVNTLSSRYGMGAFPPHTEAAYLARPPRFLLLYCVRPGDGGRDTVLFDGAEIFGQISWPRRCGTWVVRAGRRPYLCRAVWLTRSNEIAIRYDRECQFPRGQTALSEEESISEFVFKSAPTSIAWQEGKLLIVNNMRMLHGRGEARSDDRDRWLKRVVVESEAPL